MRMIIQVQADGEYTDYTVRNLPNMEKVQLIPETSAKSTLSISHEDIRALWGLI